MSIITGAGLQSFRNIFTGGSAYALAEIIDNSIQWKTPNRDCDINIIIIEKNKQINKIYITDNGVGMDEDAIQTCLLFGGGSNHGAKKGLGKFGIGLPYSSCSQSPNYHVYSWQEESKYLHTYRNHNKYDNGQVVFDEKVETLSSLPNEILEILPVIRSYKTGTIIEWKDCDQVDVKRAKTLIRHIENTLGRIYRHYINHGVNINFIVCDEEYRKNDDLCRPIKILDPLFLKENTCLPGKYATKATSKLWREYILNFEEKDSDGNIIDTHEIKFRYSLADLKIQLATGNTVIGRIYGKCQGISLVRENRELKLDTFNFPLKNGVSDPRHRWWGLEVLFSPKTDHLLGVNANKLDAKNFRYLSSDDYDDLKISGFDNNVLELRNQISKEIKNYLDDIFEVIKKRKKGSSKAQNCPTCENRTFVNGKCTNENCGHTTNKCPIHEVMLDEQGICPTCESIKTVDICIVHKIPYEPDGTCPRCSKQPPINLTEDERAELEDLLSNYPEFENNKDAISKTIDWFIKSSKKHFIVFTDIRNPMTFIDYHQYSDDKFFIVEVNTSHPFYENFMKEIIEEGNDDEMITPLLIFILSWVDSEAADYSNKALLRRFRGRFGSNLADIIANWLPQNTV